jgi:hypothetical protein
MPMISTASTQREYLQAPAAAACHKFLLQFMAIYCVAAFCSFCHSVRCSKSRTHNRLLLHVACCMLPPETCCQGLRVLLLLLLLH